MPEETASPSSSDVEQSAEGDSSPIQEVSEGEADPGPIETAEAQFSENDADGESIQLVDP